MERCPECGQPADWRGLQAHHLQVKGMGGRKDEGPTVKLCGPCHAKRHGIREVDSKPAWNKAQNRDGVTRLVCLADIIPTKAPK